MTKAKAASDGDPTSLDTRRKTRTLRALTFAEVPAGALKQLVDVVEERMHLIEPFGCFRGAIGRFRERVNNEARERRAEADKRDCGGDLIALTTMSWRDRRLEFEIGCITVIPPPLLGVA